MQTNFISKVALACCATLSLAACGDGSGSTGSFWGNNVDVYEDEPEFRDEFLDDDFGYDYGESLDALSASISGDLGPVSVSGDATVDGYRDAWYTSVFSTIDNGPDAGMTILNIEGDLNDSQYDPGTVRTYDAYEYDGPDAGFISVTGCSGEEVGNWEWDVPAEVVEVEITQDPIEADVINVNYVATFVDYYSENATGETIQVVSGTVALRR